MPEFIKVHDHFNKEYRINIDHIVAYEDYDVVLDRQYRNTDHDVVMRVRETASDIDALISGRTPESHDIPDKMKPFSESHYCGACKHHFCGSDEWPCNECCRSGKGARDYWEGREK